MFVKKAFHPVAAPVHRVGETMNESELNGVSVLLCSNLSFCCPRLHRAET